MESVVIVDVSTWLIVGMTLDKSNDCAMAIEVNDIEEGFKFVLTMTTMVPVLEGAEYARQYRMILLVLGSDDSDDDDNDNDDDDDEF